MHCSDALSRAFDAREDSTGAWSELEHTFETGLKPEIGTLNTNVPQEEVAMNYVLSSVLEGSMDVPDLGGVSITAATEHYFNGAIFQKARSVT